MFQALKVNKIDPFFVSSQGATLKKMLTFCCACFSEDGKGDEEEDAAIASGRLAEIIKESMRVFWEFVRADKDYGNVIFKASQHHRVDLKDPMIPGLMVDIKAQLQKVCSLVTKPHFSPMFMFMVDVHLREFQTQL